MKKILAIIVSFLLSAFNSLDFNMAGDKQYSVNDYYTIDVEDAPDYREFYSGTPSASNKTSCKTTNYSAQGKKVNMTSNVSYSGYWFENGVSKSEDILSDDTKFTFTSSGYIIMPFDGTLSTDSTTNNGKNMTVVCNIDNKQYRITFENMECWYCDVGRENIDESNGYHTSDNQKDKTFKAGNVLGRAVGGETTVEIKPIKNGSVIGSCSIKQFYQLTYTED